MLRATIRARSLNFGLRKALFTLSEFETMRVDYFSIWVEFSCTLSIYLGLMDIHVCNTLLCTYILLLYLVQAQHVAEFS